MCTLQKFPPRKCIMQFFYKVSIVILPSRNPAHFCLFSGQVIVQNVVIVDRKLPICKDTKIQTKNCSYGIKKGPKCHLPSSLAVFWTRSNISAFSSAANRLGTSPAPNHNFDNQSDSDDQWPFENLNVMLMSLLNLL